MLRSVVAPLENEIKHLQDELKQVYQEQVDDGLTDKLAVQISSVSLVIITHLSVSYVSCDVLLVTANMLYRPSVAQINYFNIHICLFVYC